MAKILFITTRLPYPTNEGHQIRTYNLLKRVCQTHEVHYLSLQRSDDDVDAKAHLSTLCKSVTTFAIPNEHSRIRFLKDLGLGFLTRTPFVIRKYFSNELKVAIEQTVKNGNFDLVHFDMLPLAQYAPFIGNTPYVLNNHNVESLLLKRRAENSNNIFEKVFFNNQSKSLHHFEINACQFAQETFVCSQTDVDVLTTMAPKAQFSVVENGVDTQFFPFEDTKTEQDSLVFVGGMGWFPNKDGMLFFINEVMPLLVTKRQNIKLTLIGKSAGVEIPSNLKNNIFVTGFVDDFRPIVASSSVYILPIRVGSGTRLKLLEAMSMGKAIVSTDIGAEGVTLVNNNNVMYANSASEFTETILALLNDNEKIEKLGKNARSLAENQYDWDIISNKLLNSYHAILTK